MMKFLGKKTIFKYCYNLLSATLMRIFEEIGSWSHSQAVDMTTNQRHRCSDSSNDEPSDSWKDFKSFISFQP